MTCCEHDVSKFTYNKTPPVHPNCRCSIEDNEWILKEDACKICQKAANAWARRRKSMENSINGTLDITKTDDEQRTVFGWANVSINEDGETIEDSQGHMIDSNVLEKAAYGFVLHHRVGKQEHVGPPVASLIESMYFSKSKQELLGIDVHEGWFVGFQIHDESVWKRVKSGELSMFSIGGTAEEYEEDSE